MSGFEPGPHDVRVVESILGVPLLPERVEGVSLSDGNFQRFAFDSVVQAVEARRPGAVQPDGIDLDTSLAEELSIVPEMQRLAMELQAANDTLTAWHWPPGMPEGADPADSPRGVFQSRAMGGIVAHSQRIPEQETSGGGPSRHGLVTVAPPGAGKSALQGAMFNAAGIGLPISEGDPRRRTAVGIVHTLALVKQMLDPTETLQRSANVGGRTITMGAYVGDRHDGHGEYDVIWTTPGSYTQAVERGAINLETTVRYSLDEAHRTALAPRMQPHLTRLPSGLYMFTATPAIAYGRRDLRDRYAHTQFGSMREFIEDGILSPVQLFTYRAGPERGSAEAIALRLAADYVRSGRKTLIVCQPGDALQQARDMAKRLNELFERGEIQPHAKFNFSGDKLACAFGAHPELDSEADLERLRRGERLIATTVATGKEGLNITDLDGLILIGPHGAQWEVDQWLGRVLRKDGEVAVASEILPYNLTPGKPLASIFAMLGREGMIVSGQYIGPRTEEIDEMTALAGDAQRLAPPLPLPSTDDIRARASQTILSPASKQDGRNAVVGAPADQNQQNIAGTPPAGQGYTPPAELTEFMLTDVPLREATVAPEDIEKMRPPEYRPLVDLAPPGVPVEWLYNILDKVDVATFLQELSDEELSAIQDRTFRYALDRDEGEGDRLTRYYSPLARLYFEKHPVPPLAGSAEFSDEQIATMLGVSRRFVRETIEGLGIQRLNRITKFKRNPNLYDLDAFGRIAAEAAKIPTAELTDVAVADLCHDTSPDFVKYYIERHGVAAPLKRRNALWGINDTVRHLSEADADVIRDAYERIGTADTTKLIGITEMAQLAGMPLSTFLTRFRAIPEEQRPEIGWLRGAPGQRPAEYVDREWGKAFAEYAKPEKILPWEATGNMVAAYFGRKPLAMNTAIARRPELPRPRNIPLPGVKAAAVYPMQILRDLPSSTLPGGTSKPIMPASNAPSFDPERAALTAHDAHDRAKTTYSQWFQSFYISPDQIAPPDEVSYYARRRVVPPSLPAPAPLPRDAMLPDERRPVIRTRNTAADIQLFLASLGITVDISLITRAPYDYELNVTPIPPDATHKEETFSHNGARHIVRAIMRDMGIDPLKATFSED